MAKYCQTYFLLRILKYWTVISSVNRNYSGYVNERIGVVMLVVLMAIVVSLWAVQRQE
jgi:hypothetical protein